MPCILAFLSTVPDIAAEVGYGPLVLFHTNPGSAMLVTGRPASAVLLNTSRVRVARVCNHVALQHSATLSHLVPASRMPMVPPTELVPPVNSQSGFA